MADENKVQRETVMKMPKQTFATPTPQQLAAWKTKIEPTITGWTKTATGADTVLMKFKEEIANVQAGH
jgi:hypothetical protein